MDQLVVCFVYFYRHVGWHIKGFDGFHGGHGVVVNLKVFEELQLIGYVKALRLFLQRLIFTDVGEGEQEKMLITWHIEIIKIGLLNNEMICKRLREEAIQLFDLRLPIFLDVLMVGFSCM